MPIKLGGFRYGLRQRHANNLRMTIGRLLVLPGWFLPCKPFRRSLD